VQAPSIKLFHHTTLLERIGRTGLSYGVAGFMAGRAMQVVSFEDVDSLSFTTAWATYGLVIQSSSAMIDKVISVQASKQVVELNLLIIRIISIVSAVGIYHIILGRKFIVRLALTLSLLSVSYLIFRAGTYGRQSDSNLR
jgi:hypothetical protein